MARAKRRRVPGRPAVTSRKALSRTAAGLHQSVQRYNPILSALLARAGGTIVLPIAELSAMDGTITMESDGESVTVRLKDFEGTKRSWWKRWGS